MNKLKLFKQLFLIAFLFFCSKGFSQLSKTHFIPPLTSAEQSSSNPADQYIYISTPSTAQVNYTIIPLGEPSFSHIRGAVSNTTPQVISIGTGNGKLFIPASQTSTVVNDRGYIIEAEGSIYVSVRMIGGGGSQAGALVSKGSAAPGNTFRVGSFTNENPSNNYLNFVSVMATEDNTQVTFSDLPAGLIIKNYSGATPVNITLNKGESYTIATNSDDTSINRDGLIGALVNSDKPIVVNCGSTNGSFHNGGGRDYGIDQIVGLDKVGTEYIFVKGDGNNNWENVLIVAHSDNTAVTINGSGTSTSINAGEYLLIEGNQYSNGNMYVETSQPVFAYQGVGSGTNEANQGLFFVPPLSCETRGNLDNIANIQSIGNTTFTGGITIVTKVGATVSINNLALSNFSTTGPITVAGKPDYVTYKVLNLSGNISIQSTDELYCAYFNFNGVATSGSFYSGFPTPPEINFNAVFASLGNCIPNVTLEVANMGNFDSIEWFFDDGSGSGFVTTNATSLQYTPTLSGTYKLIGKLLCSGLTLESLEVPVSICPDDIDNDGIPDNIDIDNDNDGILNCTESNGNQTIDLSNINSGNIPVGTYTFTGTSSVNGNTATTPFTGANNGVFASESSGKNGNLESSTTYTLDFDKPLNLLINYPNSSPLSSSTISTNQEFIIRVPNTRTITLLDPDDQLLIDTNFDGVYETGITQISAFEIRFKPKTTIAFGSGTFSFSANMVDNITYIHKNTSDTTSNQATFQITVTCVAKDNDLDGIEDSLDLDSDNDGIPDFIENQGKIIPLSNVDTDGNGLDDAYDISAAPIDTDNDGVLDVYDLDSDNDGVFDLVETGALGSHVIDDDFNGIDDGTSFGTNGWIDRAETSADSNEIGYTLSDFDNDTIFNYIDMDADGDTCSDVIEAGFSDNNADNYLGDTATITVDTNGLVTNASDGYTLPDFNYLTNAPLSITTQPTDATVCENSETIISIVSNEAEMFQWEVSTDGSTWNTIIDDTNYSNSQTANLTISDVPSTFNTYQYRAKLDRSGNSCGLYSNSATLTVNTLPIVNSAVILIQCDDDDLSTLGYSPFNLNEANTKISTNASTQKFSYYLTQTAAELGDETSPDFISNPITFTNRTISNDVVWARIENTFGCGNVSEVQLQVSTTVVPPNLLIEFSQCDDFLDINGNNNANNNDADGIATFDFSSVNSTLLALIPAGQTPLPPRYYRNETDALAEINEITDISNYRNIGYPNSQIIYVRIDSDISNDCLGLGGHIQLTVEALPVANPVTITRQCDDDVDGAFPFDTSTLESNIVGTQNPANVTISYFDSIGNPLLYSDGTTVISPIAPTFLTANQTITIRVTNNSSTAPDGPCIDETTVTFTVDASPVANAVAPIIVCDGSAGDIDNDGIFTFDTSTFTSTILGTQTGMDIFYTYTDPSGVSVTNTALPNPLISETQTIKVDVVNPINTTCVASTTIELVVNPLPDFTVDSPLIICSSDPSFSVDLDPIEASVIDSFTYEWYFEDGTFLSNQPILQNVTVAGTYSVTLTKTDGTGCSRTRDIIVDASEIANITLADVTIVDISNNNSVTIDPTNSGSGDYEYALRAEGSNFITYQTEPVFTNVRAGFYTIYVKDVICGTAELNISVIGHAPFFTPNGDGYNDYWQVKGLNSSTQPNSQIFIFDRYNKLLKQFPAGSAGWDGTYHGTPLPTDDYWFRVQLEDGRAFSGHFTLKR
ncbi:T9SS type B sorting domain-containing protein [Algibacter miyuki]|uniref:T9SS type B sorting domain-containing protein n=1 Tax=Algibacter miyuki TaxID=1306933 RepID=A0ABV5GZZ8_9FLAO|nr:T9SS type B sorting domain-containing protein [Algibacter miyuki]MDN3666764.1 T9SS type B sorting domain-containing protein [Algibacter miyuki]